MNTHAWLVSNNSRFTIVKLRWGRQTQWDADFDLKVQPPNWIRELLQEKKTLLYIPSGNG